MRALIFGAMSPGATIHTPLSSPDVTAMLEALKQLGAQIHVGSSIHIARGAPGKVEPEVIDVGNSGQAFRFVGALAALQNTVTTLTGDQSIQTRRPIAPLLSGIEQLGGSCAQTGGRVSIQGPIQAGRAHINGEASQPVSGLLIAAAFLKGQTHLTVENPGEHPWIDLTLSWLEKMGAKIEREGYHSFKIEGSLEIAPFETVIPGDWSAAAFPLVAAMVTGSALHVDALDPDDLQGDRRIVTLLEEMGAEISGNLFIRPHPFWGRVVDANTMIDAVPILAVLGCYAQSPLQIVNAAIARRKESDRLHAMCLELRKMGAHVTEQPSGLTIYPSKLKGAKVHAHGDHRVAMALAVAGMGAQGTTEITGCDCIQKSFPTFKTAFQTLGADLQ